MLEQKSGEFSYETPGQHVYHHPHAHHDVATSQIKISLDDSALDGYREAPESYPSLKRAHSQSNMSRRSFGSYEELFSDPRLQRLQQAEASIRREMFKECTFRPAIKNLPAQYGPLKETGTPFVTRMEKWKKEKEQQVEMKKKMTQKSAEDACTFKPRINRLSNRAVQQIRGDSPQAAHERLFRVSVALHESRRRVLEEESEREAAEMQRDCPFTPTLLTRDSYAHVQAKVLRPTQSKDKGSRGAEVTATGRPKDFTFTPRINRVRPSMASAQIYLKTPVVQRLSRPVKEAVAGQGAVVDEDEKLFDTSGHVIDAHTFLQTLSAHGNATNSGESPAAEQEGISGASKLSKEDKERRRASFRSFLARQDMQLKRREEKKLQLEKHLEPSFRPQLKTEVAEISAEPVSATSQSPDPNRFLERVAADVQRRLSQEQRAEIEALAMHPFKPVINKKAESMRARSTFEMSRGDLLRREANQRMLKLKADQELLANVTLVPAISQKAREARSVIGSIYKNSELSGAGVHGDSGSRAGSDSGAVSPSAAVGGSDYMTWLKEKEAKLQEKRAAEAKRREEAEMAGCTFTPKTIECPAYIKRIKHSLDLVKAARGAGNSVMSDKSKPDWR